MDQKKVVNMIELALAGILAGLYLHGVFYLSNVLNFESKIPEHDLVLSFTGALVLLGAFLVFNRQEAIHKFFSQVVEEFSRVTWPSKIEVRGATVVVTIFIIVCALIWGGFDAIVNRVIAAVVGI